MFLTNDYTSSTVGNALQTDAAAAVTAPRATKGHFLSTVSGVLENCKGCSRTVNWLSSCSYITVDVESTL